MSNLRSQISLEIIGYINLLMIFFFFIYEQVILRINGFKVENIAFNIIRVIYSLSLVFWGFKNLPYEALTEKIITYLVLRMIESILICLILGFYFYMQFVRQYFRDLNGLN
jgi:hypothetical protein